MFSCIKGFMKAGFITAAVLAATGVGVLAIAGEGRTRAIVHQVHESVLEQIDGQIQDPSALRSQLQELEREYPKKISMVRGDLAELKHEIRLLERDKAVAQRVVGLIDEDLAHMEPVLEEAASRIAGGEARAVPVAFGGHVYSFERAQNKTRNVRNTRIAYANRAADAEHDLTYLHQQAERLEGLATELEAERAEFQLQISQLSRQVDAIARNERLINMLEDKSRTLEECSRYDIGGLDHITSRLSEIRSRQEAELDLLSGPQEEDDYESLARIQLSAETIVIENVRADSGSRSLALGVEH